MGKKSKKARVGGGAEGDAAATATPAAAVTDKGEAEVAATGGKRKSDIDDIFGAIAGSGGKKSKATPTANATVRADFPRSSVSQKVVLTLIRTETKSWPEVCHSAEFLCKS
jgi:hypothetical protein